MKNITKRILALVLSFVMVITSLPIMANATQGDKTKILNSEKEVYTIIEKGEKFELTAMIEKGNGKDKKIEETKIGPAEKANGNASVVIKDTKGEDASKNFVIENNTKLPKEAAKDADEGKYIVSASVKVSKNETKECKWYIQIGEDKPVEPEKETYSVVFMDGNNSVNKDGSTYSFEVEKGDNNLPLIIAREVKAMFDRDFANEYQDDFTLNTDGTTVYVSLELIPVQPEPEKETVTISHELKFVWNGTKTKQISTEDVEVIKGESVDLSQYIKTDYDWNGDYGVNTIYYKAKLVNVTEYYNNQAQPTTSELYNFKDLEKSFNEYTKDDAKALLPQPSKDGKVWRLKDVTFKAEGQDNDKTIININAYYEELKEEKITVSFKIFSHYGWGGVVYYNDVKPAMQVVKGTEDQYKDIDGYKCIDKKVDRKGNVTFYYEKVEYITISYKDGFKEIAESKKAVKGSNVDEYKLDIDHYYYVGKDTDWYGNVTFKYEKFYKEYTVEVGEYVKDQWINEIKVLSGNDKVEFKWVAMPTWKACKGKKVGVAYFYEYVLNRYYKVTVVEATPKTKDIVLNYVCDEKVVDKYEDTVDLDAKVDFDKLAKENLPKGYILAKNYLVPTDNDNEYNVNVVAFAADELIEGAICMTAGLVPTKEAIAKYMIDNAWDNIVTKLENREEALLAETDYTDWIKVEDCEDEIKEILANGKIEGGKYLVEETWESSVAKYGFAFDIKTMDLDFGTIKQNRTTQEQVFRDAIKEAKAKVKGISKFADVKFNDELTVAEGVAPGYVDAGSYPITVYLVDEDEIQYVVKGTLEATWSRNKKKTPKNDTTNILDDPMAQAGGVIETLRTDRPTDMLTRSEFVGVLAEVFKVIDTEKYKDFQDITGDENEAQIKQYSSFEIVKGYCDEQFGPNDFITREQMYAILARALKFSGKAQALTDEQIDAAIAKVLDNVNVSDWARVDVANAIEEGIFTSEEKPLEQIQRAEAADKLEKFVAIIYSEVEEEIK